MDRRNDAFKCPRRNLRLLLLLILFLFIPTGDGQLPPPPTQTIKFLLLADTFQVTIVPDVKRSLEELVASWQQVTTSVQTVFYSASKEDETWTAVCRELSNGVTVIVDATENGYVKLKATADQNFVPYFRIEPTIGPFARAAAEYVLNLNATDAALIFQNDADMQQGTRALLANSRLRITSYATLRNDTAWLLRENRPWPDMFLLFAEVASITNILTSAVNYGIVNQDQQWLVVVLNLVSVNAATDWLVDLPYAVGELKPSVPEMCCPLSKDSAGCDCLSPPPVISSYITRVFDYLIDVVDSGDSLILPIKRIDCATLPNKVDEGTNQKLDDLTTLYQQVLQRHPILQFDTVRRRISYRAAMDVNVVRARSAGRTFLASWNPEKGLLVAAGREVTAPRQLLRVGMMEAEPWSFKRNGKWEGYYFSLLEELGRIMDFDYDVVTITMLGERLNTSIWTGGIGLLAKGDLDLICAPLTMTAERDEVIDFITPYIENTGLTIVIKQPVQETSLFKFMTVLKTEVWIALVVSIIITSILMYVLEKFSPYSYSRSPERYPYECRVFDLKECFWFTLTSFTPQGGGEPPKNLSARILVAAYWFFVVLMLATFTANLAAFLTVEKMQVPISSMEQLARQSKIQYGVMRGGIAETFFFNMNEAEKTLYRAWTAEVMNSDLPIYRVWNYPVREQYSVINTKVNNASDTGVLTLRDGLDRVVASDGNYAFIHDALILRYEVLRNCSLVEVGEMFADQPYALGVPTGSPLTRDFSRAILQMQRDRFFEEITARTWNKSRRAQCNLGQRADSGITLESIGGVFIAMLAGLGLAVVTLAAEVFYYRRKIEPTKPRLQMPTVNDKKEPPPTKKEALKKQPSSILKKEPSERNVAKKKVTLGDKQGLESKTGLPKVSYITVYPRQ
ncbi:ionotropic receptor 25a-like [Neocloeon triangulifer]|uniref:ionotropic receptor 25a-like n=1 Tax=Neocloeon triangulifer TaxID=2078957 RepID=UPI00286F5A22|nr:ionotropic receptor 25a-like [Neocloeon triangulifer]